MGWSFREWRRRRLLRRARIDDAVWSRVVACLPFLGGLRSEELRRLRELATIFVHEKSIHGAGGLEVNEAMRVTVAAQACLLVLELGLDSYAGWEEVIVYPDEFLPEVEWTDENGVVHVGREPRMGESWLGGPVVLSWEDVATGAEIGVNVVIHEFAHKLDMLNGDANGFPPLHAGMSREAWTAAFTQAYDDLCLRVDRGESTVLDPYASESPAEFFAVASEAFFEAPTRVQQAYPEVYRQLSDFYRQDPAARLAAYGVAAGARG